MNAPTHNEISQQAQQLWRNYGCPAGRDTEIWLEAERKLNEDPAADTSTTSANSEAAAESDVENHLSPAQKEQTSIQAAMQKEDARAPQVPHNTGPKTKPAETGKPLWPRPHSS